MNPIEGVRFIRADAMGSDDVKRAYCGVGAELDASMRAQDFACDIVQVMDRFPIFPPLASP